MKIQNIQKQKGFTLVEIAIVLVIIGLLLGGVLKGQELIENSKVKSVAADFNNISAAYYAYRDRTNTYPDVNDSDSFWYNLKKEGFIKGALGSSTGSVGPTHAFDGIFTVETGVGLDPVLTNAICADLLDEATAKSIDSKLDDGAGTTGSVQSVDGLTYVGDTDIKICKKL